MNDNFTLKSEFNRLSVRIEHIFHVDAMMDDERLPESIRNAIQSDFHDIKESLESSGFLDQAHARDATQVEQMIEEQFADEAATFGWLVKARQPEFTVVDNGEIHFSWAPVRTVWIHKSTYEAAIRAALDWAECYSREVWGEEE